MTFWHSALRRYFFVIATVNLVWEFAHMPLYTIWKTGSRNEIIFAAVHCTGGDILIAMSSLMGVLLFLGNSKWPVERFKLVAGLTLLTGLAYTIFSEWLNIEVRGAWAYSDIMPLVPIIEAGLSPVLQWIIVPLLGFAVIKRALPKQ